MGSRRVPGSDDRATTARATAVILEDIRSQNKVVVEAVRGLVVKVDGIDLRLGVVEEKVDHLGLRMGAVEERMGAVEERMGAVEERMGAVEERLGAVEHDLSGFRAEILKRIARLEDAVLENSRRLQSVEAELRAIKDALTTKADAAALVALELRVAALERIVKSG